MCSMCVTLSKSHSTVLQYSQVICFISTFFVLYIFISLKSTKLLFKFLWMVYVRNVRIIWTEEDKIMKQMAFCGGKKKPIMQQILKM